MGWGVLSQKVLMANPLSQKVLMPGRRRGGGGYNITECLAGCLHKHHALPVISLLTCCQKEVPNACICLYSQAAKHSGILPPTPHSHLAWALFGSFQILGQCAVSNRDSNCLLVFASYCFDLNVVDEFTQLNIFEEFLGFWDTSTMPLMGKMAMVGFMAKVNLFHQTKIHISVPIGISICRKWVLIWFCLF